MCDNFLSTNPTTLILSSLVSEFWQRIQIWKEKKCGFEGVCAGEGGEEVEGTLELKQETRLSREVKYKNSNYLQNVKHVVQSTFKKYVNNF